MDESFSEVVRTSVIPFNITNMNKNINMGDGMSTFKAQGNPSVITSYVPISIVLSYTIETANIDTSTSLPPFVTPTPISLPTSTISPTFNNIMNQPITSLFTSRSTECNQSIPEQEEDEVMASFADILFDSEEETIPDHMLMYGKQFKILNRKLNSLIQTQEDTGTRNTVTGIDVDVLLKAQEHQLKMAMEQIESKYEERLKRQAENFQSEVKDLMAVAKERHIFSLKKFRK